MRKTMTGEGVGIETGLHHHHPALPFTSNRSFPKGHVPQECHLLNVSPLMSLLDIVTFFNCLLVVLRVTAAWRWLAATGFWTHFKTVIRYSLSDWASVSLPVLILSSYLSSLLCLPPLVLQCISLICSCSKQPGSFWDYDVIKPSGEMKLKRNRAMNTLAHRGDILPKPTLSLLVAW